MRIDIPMLHGHECPSRVSMLIDVFDPVCTKDTFDALWANDLDLDISSPAMVNPDPDVDVFQ